MTCPSKNQTRLSDLVARNLFIACQMVDMLGDRTLEKTEWRLDTDLHGYAVPTGV
jgi:hypothetical protein